MITILPESENRTLVVAVSGKLTTEDYDKIEPELELRAGQEGKFDLLVELTEIDGVEPAAIRDDLSFAKKYSDDIGRMAVLTDETVWQRCIDFLGKPFSAVLGIEMERFDDRSDAQTWLRSDR
jgi:hypothetical protein